MKAVGYVRVSTEMQSIEQQKKAIEDFAKKYNIKIVAFFEDPDTSGAIRFEERPKVREMLDFCRTNNIKIILIYDLTRFGRYDTIDILNDIKKLREQGFTILFVAEPVIDDPHFKKFWEFIKGWFAEYERYQISQRTKLKIKYKIDNGELAYRPKLEHYIASVIFNKDLKDVTKEDVEKVELVIMEKIKECLKMGIKKKDILNYLIKTDQTFKRAYEKFGEKLPKSYWVIYRYLKKIENTYP